MRFIPNQNSWVGFCAAITGTLLAPKLADINAAVVLTGMVQGITASSTGQTVPTPAFDSEWNGSIPGTVDGTFSMDGYRDSIRANDLVWTTLPRGTVGTMIIARSGGKPTTASFCECWDIDVTSRSVPAMTSNTPVGVSVMASVPVEPGEDATVVAS